MKSLYRTLVEIAHRSLTDTHIIALFYLGNLRTFNRFF